MNEQDGWVSVMALMVKQEMARKEIELKMREAQPGYSEWAKKVNREYFEARDRLNEGRP